MKKINIFNRNTNSPSYRRTPVSGGFNRGGGIPLFSGMTAVIFALFIATPSFATPTELDKKTVASKAYVDTKQDIIETGNVMFHDDPDGTEGDIYVPGLVAYDSQTNALSGNKIGILDMQTIYDDEGDLGLYSNSGGGYGSEMDNYVPTVRAVAEALQNIRDNLLWAPLNWNNTQSTAINAYNSTFGNGTNQWAGDSSHLINGQFLANSLVLKQNKIPAGTTPQGLYTNGSVLTYTNSAGTVGEKYIIDEYTWVNLANGDMEWTDDYRGMLVDAEGISNTLWYKQKKLPAVWTSTTGTRAIASTGGQTIDLGAYDGEVGRRYITAGGAQPLTQKAGADNVILYINGTKTLAQYQTSNFGGIADDATTNQNYIKGALVSLELLKDVYSALHNEIQNATPTGTPGNVAMYDATTGALSNGVATYSGATAQNPYNATNDADKIATAAAVETKQTKRVCAGYEPGHENEANYCWLWDFPD